VQLIFISKNRILFTILFFHIFQFLQRINQSQTIATFLEKDAAFWTKLIKDCILNQKWVTIYATPSKEAGIDFEKAEEGRINERRMRLGVDVCKTCLKTSITTFKGVVFSGLGENGGGPRFSIAKELNACPRIYFG